MDNDGAIATDAMIITNPGTEGPIGPPGLQGEQGPPGMTPEEVAAMQVQIDQNRYLLEQLPQLRKKLEELESQTQ